MNDTISLDTVYVWDDKKCDFVETHYTRVVCDECGAQYADGGFVWDEVGGVEMLVCPDCGQQFYTEKED